PENGTTSGISADWGTEHTFELGRGGTKSSDRPENGTTSGISADWGTERTSELGTRGTK
ncbi:hypothetical protein KI387_036852, partial [Taxus chinensis]